MKLLSPQSYRNKCKSAIYTCYAQCGSIRYCSNPYDIRSWISIHMPSIFEEMEMFEAVHGSDDFVELMCEVYNSRRARNMRGTQN